MRIEHSFEYDAHWQEIADEFCAHDSDYQAETLNIIGQQFKIWSQGEKSTSTCVQLFEIAENLNDYGKWFVETLCYCMNDKSESEVEG